jgi:hypothetical protein
VRENSPITDDQADEAAFQERRTVGYALTRWDELRDQGGMPNRSSCLAVFDEDFLPGTFVVEISDNDDEDTIIDCGSKFREALGRNPVGKAMRDVMPSATERGLEFWRVAAELKKPIADVGEFTNPNGHDILYRSVFLPVSEDGVRITHLIGAFSYRMVH